MARILLVEDEPAMARGVARALCREDHDVRTAGGGRSALRTFARWEPQLVLLDWMLPDRNGLEVLASIRRAGTVPVLMITSRAAIDDRVSALRLGADDYLPKPFDLRELVARVDALLRRVTGTREAFATDRHVSEDRSRPGPGSAVERGRSEPTADSDDDPLCAPGVELDVVRHDVRVDGQHVDLAPREFALLAALLRRPGFALSRRWLMDTVWVDTPDATPRSVDNAVLRLRRVLGRQAEALQTVRGLGYRWRPRPCEQTP